MSKFISAQIPPLNPHFETHRSVVNINDVFTDTLLVEILQRLNCVTVIRVKLVCKRWRYVIDDTLFVPTFIRYHDQLRLPVTLVYQFLFWHRILTEEPGSKIQSHSDHLTLKTRKFNLNFMPCFSPKDRHPIWLAASSKDVLVCCDTKMKLQATYYICNPLTKQWVAVPPVLGHHVMADTAMGLVVIKKGIYRLVRVLELDSHPNNNQFDADMFCSEIGKWAKFKVTCPISFKRSWQFKPNASVINNKLHWLINDKIIVVFNPFEGDPRSCRVINLPPELNSRRSICLGSCQDRLKVCQLTGGPSNGKMMIWEFVNYATEKWELMCKINVNDMSFVNNMYIHDLGAFNIEVLAFHPSDPRILYLRTRNYIVICNLECRMLQVVSECLEDSTFSLGTCGVFLLTHPSWPSILDKPKNHLAIISA